MFCSCEYRVGRFIYKKLYLLDQLRTLHQKRQPKHSSIFCHVVIDRVGESAWNRGLPIVVRIVFELNDVVSPQVIGDESHANYSHGHQSIEVIMVAGNHYRGEHLSKIPNH